MNGGQTGAGGTIAQNGGYGGTAKLRVCPEAPSAIPNAPSLTVGTAHTQWTNSTLTGTGVGASYGLNGWLYDAAGTSKNQADLTYLLGISNTTASTYAASFYRVFQARNQSQVPVFADANWRHVCPKPNDPAPASLESPGPATIGSPEQYHPLQRVCMDRHDKAVNVSFLDGHGETVKLRDLWTLKWSADWTRTTPQTIQ